MKLRNKKIDDLDLVLGIRDWTRARERARFRVEHLKIRVFGQVTAPEENPRIKNFFLHFKFKNLMIHNLNHFKWDE